MSSVAFGAGILIAALSLVMSGLRAEIVLADFTTAVDAAVTGRWALYDASGGLLGITPFPRAVILGSASLGGAPVRRATTLARVARGGFSLGQPGWRL